MIVLTIRTDKPEAELGLYDGDNQLAYETWEAHRQLSGTIHKKIEALLNSQRKSWHDIKGVVCFKGPGSFTGLRIGLSVGNALATSLGVPVVSTMGEGWQIDGITQLKNGKNESVAVPEYGAPVHITKQKR